ncbi:hypothetical protein SAMN02910292_02531 [Lachnospiraceae bacterium XBB2008]|nr:hypothetical protein SAMN02910292_02531 [Lachnospiraceae bacterium XBB2008]
MEEKKGGMSEAKKRANAKYNSKFVEIKFRVSAERREEIQKHADFMGESVNRFVQRAIEEAMERDKAQKK